MENQEKSTAAGTNRFAVWFSCGVLAFCGLVLVVFGDWSTGPELAETLTIVAELPSLVFESVGASGVSEAVFSPGLAKVGDSLFQLFDEGEVIMEGILEQVDPFRVRVVYDSESEALTIARQPARR